MKIDWTKSIAYSIAASVILSVVLSLLFPPEPHRVKSTIGWVEAKEEGREAVKPYYTDPWKGMKQYASNDRPVYVYQQQGFPCEKSRQGNYMDGYGNYHCLVQEIR